MQVSIRGEWQLEIVGDGDQTIVGFAKDAVEIERHPPGTTVMLTGEASVRSPYGLRTSFNNSTAIYLKGSIGRKTVWLPTFYLSRLTENGDPKNISTNELLGLGEFKYEWRCSNR